MQMSPKLASPVSTLLLLVLPKATPPSLPLHSPHLWMGSLEEGKKKRKKEKSSLNSEGWHLKWSWGWHKGGRGGGSHAKIEGVKGHYQLFARGEPAGGQPWLLSTPEIIPNAVTCEVCTSPPEGEEIRAADIWTECANKINIIVQLWSETMKK